MMAHCDWVRQFAVAMALIVIIRQAGAARRRLVRTSRVGG